MLFFVLVSFSIAFYLYIQDKNLTKNTEVKTAEQLQQEAVTKELNNFKLPTSTKNAADVTQKLESFKIPIQNTTITTTNPSNTTPKTPIVEPKPKTATDVTKELESFKVPPKN